MILVLVSSTTTKVTHQKLDHSIAREERKKERKKEREKEKFAYYSCFDNLTLFTITNFASELLSSSIPNPIARTNNE